MLWNIGGRWVVRELGDGRSWTPKKAASNWLLCKAITLQSQLQIEFQRLQSKHRWDLILCSVFLEFPHVLKLQGTGILVSMIWPYSSKRGDDISKVFEVMV
ncbi:hypothetical protein B5807_03233 [Epicoccum nigrum]|uniref:Uncharacterized protein n=1 Tax=Epicoccum nigrum TaxID=105696 RepID=A0A1Y2M644_EPING|nr:hypothetical protein B5807_03233 [Epicoccum nigrum]